MSQPIVSLRPLARTDLAAITPWFEDPDTRRYLGGPDWPAAMLDYSERAVGESFRGAVQTAAHYYLAELDGRAVEAGVEPDNLACRRCLERAGFRVCSPEPDYEGMLYYYRAARLAEGAG